MQLHANAKTTPMARALLVQRVTRQSWSYREAAAAGWRERPDGGQVGAPRATGRRRAPRSAGAAASVAERQSPRVISAIIWLRHAGLPAWQIARRVGRPRSTVAVILRRVGLGRLVVSRPPVVRYEWPHAGEGSGACWPASLSRDLILV